MRLATFFFGLALAASATRTARADGPTADELARQTLEHDTFGFEGSEIKARLSTTDADGKKQERSFEGISKRGDDKMIKSVLRFTAPANVAGTAFLMIQHQGAPD